MCCMSLMVRVAIQLAGVLALDEERRKALNDGIHPSVG